MDQYQIVACRLCGKLMKRYMFAVYPGDSSCCYECNRKVNSSDAEEVKIPKDWMFPKAKES